MIGHLTGLLLQCSPGEIVIDAGGVGYSLQIPLSTYYPLNEKAGLPVSVHVHTNVREDAITLFGFSTTGEREMFRKLIGISGIGPKVALAVLSGIGTADLHTAVRGNDRARLQRIPGVGKKTAERILLELGDRLSGPAGRSRPQPGPEVFTGQGIGTVQHDAVSALVNLGYSEDAALRAVRKVMDDTTEQAPLETVLKEALASLVR